MRLSIRYQLLLPLLALMLGVVGMSTWTAWSSAQRARRQIETQMVAIGATMDKVSSALVNPTTLPLMKGLCGADLLLCDAAQRPVSDADGRPITTLPDIPSTLPAPAEHRDGDLGAPVRVAGTLYFARGMPL